MKHVESNRISGFKIIRLNKVESTNLYLKKLLSNGEKLQNKTLVLADNQTKGIGMGSNTWHSEPGKNLSFSVFLKPKSLSPEKQFVLNKAISLAVSDFVENRLPELKTSIKWPNDIYIGEKKLAGILILNTIKGNRLEDIIIGIGINVNQTHFPDEIPNPESLCNLSLKELNLEECLVEICTSIDRRYKEICEGEFEKIDSEYHSKLYRLGKIHQFRKEGEIFDAMITGVSKYGHLQLKTTTGEFLELAFKEVEYL